MSSSVDTLVTLDIFPCASTSLDSLNPSILAVPFFHCPICSCLVPLSLVIGSLILVLTLFSRPLDPFPSTRTSDPRSTTSSHHSPMTYANSVAIFQAYKMFRCSSTLDTTYMTSFFCHLIIYLCITLLRVDLL